jgi:hypothetical protein
MYYYETVSAAVNALQARGYTFNFNLRNDCLLCAENELLLYPADFHIDEMYRFEGDTDPADAAVVYAISAPNHDVKGVLVDGYGPSASAVAPEILAKLNRF